MTSTAGTNVISIDDIASSSIGQNFSVVGGNAQAVDIVLHLLEKGKNVTIVMPDGINNLEKGHSNWVKSFVTPMLYARGVRVWPNATIKSVGDGEMTISRETGVDVTYACDTLIEAMDMQPNTSLIEGVGSAVAVGDCVDLYNIAEAIATANLAGRKI